jgi:26S proteasome regulatory subunit N5
MQSEGDLKAASKLMQELQIETYNTMDKREKTDYILEQMRLCLETADFARAQIISRKISERLLNHADFQHEKERYYRMMIRYYENSHDYLDICRSYLSIYNTPSVKADEAKWVAVLQKVVLFLVLARHDNEQSDLLVRVTADKALDKLAVYKSLLVLFGRQELMHWPTVQTRFLQTLQQDHAREFGGPSGVLLLQGLEKRVVEHNVRIIAKYYKQITHTRMAELLHQTKDQTEVKEKCSFNNFLIAHLSSHTGTCE